MPRTLHAGRTVTLTLPLPPAALTANAARGQHWSASMLPAQTYRLLARAAAARARDALAPPASGAPWTPLARCSLALQFALPDRRRRDWDNLVAAWKPAQDGLVEARLLADDSLAVVARVTVTWRLDPAAPGLHVQITELPPPGTRGV